ncbi:MAG: hypothetical protein Q8M34_00740 [Thermodesulfovibrionales bacterium]|nr:hypothetical protein [Thermodesulfovibrionales bacterium]
MINTTLSPSSTKSFPPSNNPLHPPLLSKGELSNADTSALERQIDEMVYKLYDLTPEEIAIVEGKG